MKIDEILKWNNTIFNLHKNRTSSIIIIIIRKEDNTKSSGKMSTPCSVKEYSVYYSVAFCVDVLFLFLVVFCLFLNKIDSQTFVLTMTKEGGLVTTRLTKIFQKCI